MTEVTDKMVEAARAALNDLSVARGGLRAAIEAALSAREPLDAGELVLWLRNPTTHAEIYLKGLCEDAADAIEELVEALRKYSYDEYNGYNKDGAHARAILTSMGVKP